MSSTLHLCPFTAVPSNGRLALWEITTACNLRCRHCLAQAGERIDTEFFTELVIDSLQRLQTKEIVITGGEPLLHPMVLPMLRTLSASGITTMLYTNGILVTKNIAHELSDAGLSYVMISLDGTTKETHEMIREGKSSFDATCKAVNFLQECMIDTCVTMSVGIHNAHEAGVMVGFAEALGATELTLIPVMPLGRGASIQEEIIPDTATKANIAIAVCDAADKHPDISIERVRLPLPGESIGPGVTCPGASIITLLANRIVGTCPWLATHGWGTTKSEQGLADQAYTNATYELNTILCQRDAHAGCPLAAALAGRGVLGIDPLVESV